MISHITKGLTSSRLGGINSYYINIINNNSIIVSVEKQKCMTPECGAEEELDPLCPVTPWSDWSACSVSCGRGARVRMRLSLAAPENAARCDNTAEMTQRAPCSERPDCTLDMATTKRKQTVDKPKKTYIYRNRGKAVK